MDDDVFQDEESGDSWLITFSDLMSLLFALFVLINSFSEVDADSFKRNAQIRPLTADIYGMWLKFSFF